MINRRVVHCLPLSQTPSNLYQAYLDRALRLQRRQQQPSLVLLPLVQSLRLLDYNEAQLVLLEQRV
jgi:hypothetical protein